MQYQVARNRSSGRSARIPATVIRWAATLPAGSVPAAIVVSRVAAASSAAGLHGLERHADHVGDQSQGRPKLDCR